jgi:hypothetical protein
MPKWQRQGSTSENNRGGFLLLIFFGSYAMKKSPHGIVCKLEKLVTAWSSAVMPTIILHPFVFIFHKQ